VSYTEGGLTKTATFSVTINQPSGVNLGITNPLDVITADNLEFSIPQPASGYNEDFTVTCNVNNLPPLFYLLDSYQWLIDGAVQSGATSSSFTVPVSELHSGSHSVTVIIYSVWNSSKVSFSVTKTFTVQ
jgi:hypothetical protein